MKVNLLKETQILLGPFPLERMARVEKNPSFVQASEPPAVPVFTAGTTSPSNSRPVATSYTCASPRSVPFLDNDTATYLPSGDGAIKSIVVDPVASIAPGSTSTRSPANVSSDDSTTSIGWAFGGCCFIVNRTPWHSVRLNHVGAS